MGRERELERVGTALADVSLCAVVGPPGIGKTAVIDALVPHLHGVRRGQCVPALAHVAYHPLRQALDLPPPAVDPPAMARIVEKATGPGDVLVLEDLHWADRDTLAVLTGLGRRRRSVVTVESTAPGADAVIGIVGALGGAIVDLGPLDLDAAAELAGRLRPDLLSGERRRLARASGGIPLLIHALGTSESGLGGVPTGAAHATLEALVARRPPEERRTLALLAAAGGPVPAAGLEGLEQLCAARLVAVDAAGVQLLHRVFGDLALAMADPDTLRGLHAQLVDVDQGGPLPQVRHLLAAGRPEEALRAATALVTSPLTRAEQAEALRLGAEAATAVEEACGSVPSGSVGGEDLRIRAAEALNDVLAAETAASLVDDLDRFGPARRARAAVELLRAALAGGVRSADTDRILRLTAPFSSPDAGPDAGRVPRLRSILGRWRGAAAGDEDDVRNEAQLAVARSVADAGEAAMAAALAGLGRNVEEAAQWFRVARASAAATGAIGAEFEAARNLVVVQVAVGEHEEARAVARQCADRAAEEGLEAWVSEFRTYEMLSRFYDDVDQDEVLSWLSEVRGRPARMEIRAVATAVLAMGLADLGHERRSADVLDAWLDPQRLPTMEPMTRAVLLWGATQRAWVLGQFDEVIRLGRWTVELLPPGFPTTAGAMVAWRWAEYESGLSGQAPDPAGGLRPAAALEAAAITALREGRHRDAACGFLEAAESWRPIVWRCTLRCWWGAGVALTAAGDRSEAVSWLERTDAELDRSGIPALRPRVRSALRRARGSVPTPAGAAQGRLTAQEQRVLSLVGEGYRSAEIAQRLGISVDTVNDHVRSATAKLGSRSRTEAAARLRSERDVRPPGWVGGPRAD